MSVFHACVKNFHEFIAVEGSLLREIFDKDTFFGILPNEEFLLFFWFQEVHDLFIVEFEIRAGDKALGIFHSVDSGKELIEGLLHESVIFTNHGMGLA